MPSLKLSPLPSLRTDDQSGSLLLEREGFVDEAVVRSMVDGSCFARSTGYPEDLALIADDSDFAGWQVTRTKTPQGAEVPPFVIDAIMRRAAPQVPAKSISAKCRWWFAGWVCVLSTLGLSILLLPHSQGPVASSAGASAAPQAASADQVTSQP